MLLDKKITVKWHNFTKSHYEKLGYKYTKLGEEFEIDVYHLPLGSGKQFRVLCDYCKINVIKRIRIDLENNISHCCNKCKGKKVANTQIKNAAKNGNSLAEKFPELISEWHPKNKLTPWDYAFASNKKVYWKCNNGHEWEANINSRTNMKSNCPNCKETKGEKKIRKFLENMGIDFTQEYSFKNLLSEKGKPLRFDFAIFNKNNIIFLIEFDGEQHFRPAFGKEQFKIQLYRDNLKNVFCIENNIPLLRIRYDEYEEIENIIRRYIDGINL